MMQTLKQINDNPIYAPIGYENDFKRRIFLDNFQRCMTIRTFQKTAGIEIKKKVTQTPTAKIIQDKIDKHIYHFGDREFSWKRIFLYDDLSRKDKVNELLLKGCKHLYTTKTGKVVKKKENRVIELLDMWDNQVKYKLGNGEEPQKQNSLDGLFRIGFFNYLEAFKDDIKGNQIMEWTGDFWECRVYLYRWIPKHQKHYFYFTGNHGHGW